MTPSGHRLLGLPERNKRSGDEEKHYHQPSDEIQPDWNFDGMVEDAQLGFYVGVNVANAAQTPTWVPGDEFDAARKAALGKLEKE